MVAGREATPQDAANTARLMHYWAHGEGADEIDWDTPGDYNRCLVALGRYVGPGQVHGLCQHLHIMATGAPAGHAPGEQAAAGAKHKGKT
ncbi:hypothetical protein GCM10010174_61690 [Kutzneria viridogrisea]|uniref:Uncharacterized protein n=1 Tax=Kutzneria viridogrisea TaxID=47990 RepID=A0ABR6BG99_9PSEU|nr:hypothetical protein [Kutzneria viridogrisea]